MNGAGYHQIEGASPILLEEHILNAVEKELTSICKWDCRTRSRIFSPYYSLLLLQCGRCSEIGVICFIDISSVSERDTIILRHAQSFAHVKECETSGEWSQEEHFDLTTQEPSKGKVVEVDSETNELANHINTLQLSGQSANNSRQERDTKVRFAPEPAAVREVESTKDPELWYSEAVCKLLALQKAHDTLVAQTLGCSLVSFYDFTRWVQQTLPTSDLPPMERATRQQDMHPFYKEEVALRHCGLFYKQLREQYVRYSALFAADEFTYTDPATGETYTRSTDRESNNALCASIKARIFELQQSPFQDKEGNRVPHQMNELAAYVAQRFLDMKAHFRAVSSLTAGCIVGSLNNQSADRPRGWTLKTRNKMVAVLKLLYIGIEPDSSVLQDTTAAAESSEGPVEATLGDSAKWTAETLLQNPALLQKDIEQASSSNMQRVQLLGLVEEVNALLHRLRLAKSNSIGSARLVSKNQAMLSICDSQEEVAALKCALSRAQKYSICHDHEEKLLQVVKAELLKR